jgi:hypothetical protein
MQWTCCQYAIVNLQRGGGELKKETKTLFFGELLDKLKIKLNLVKIKEKLIMDIHPFWLINKRKGKFIISQYEIEINTDLLI